MRYIIIVGHLQVKICVTWLDFTAHGHFYKKYFYSFFKYFAWIM